MQFSLTKTLELLQSTPAVLEAQLSHLNGEWTDAREALHQWSPREVVAHLILCERENWMVRVRIILSKADARVFAPVDMSTHLVLAQQAGMTELLSEFRHCRQDNIQALLDLQISDADLQRTATHPKLGTVTLKQLLATWATHDQSHLIQIARTIAREYKDAVGPFVEFQRILA